VAAVTACGAPGETVPGAGAVPEGALPAAVGTGAFAGAGSKPGNDCGSGFIGSATGAKPGTGAFEAAAPLAGATAGAGLASDGAESAGLGVLPEGMLPGSSLPTFAPGTITRPEDSVAAREGVAGALARGLAGASSA
jgi:hypothetical protein